MGRTVKLSVWGMSLYSLSFHSRARRLLHASICQPHCTSSQQEKAVQELSQC